MSFITDPLYVSTILLLLVALSDRVSRTRYFTHVGSALTVILAAAILANFGLISSSSNAPALYDGIFSFGAPIAIFFLLLNVQLKDLHKANLPMLLLFGLGSACTIVGTSTGYALVGAAASGVEKLFAIAGMFTGTYIGGSVNLNAVALHYGMTKDGTLLPRSIRRQHHLGRVDRRHHDPAQTAPEEPQLFSAGSPDAVARRGEARGKGKHRCR